ncbi:hypothetical protein C2S52_016256 [Perilla frutescens var. hirtella]|nr:hypothetical protein C2S52_016256 [Perilla frutescens var. hirtella]
MADAIVSVVAEQLVSIITAQIQNKIHLVRGVDKELLDLSDKMKNIRNVLDDADRKQFKEKTVKDWLWKLEQTSYEMEDVLDEWNYAILQHNIESQSQSAASSNRKVCSFIPCSCFCFKKLVVRHDIAKKIQNLKSRLDEILREKDVYNFVISHPQNDPSPASWRVQSTSLIDLAEVQGRNHDRDILVSKLSANGGGHERLGYRVLSIVGAGGLGKTTLAQLLYNDSHVKECFDLRIWMCVSDPFDVATIAKEIIERIEKGSSPDTNQLDALLQALLGRSEMEFEKFEEVGKDIAKKCNGLPLAAKTLGSLLRFKNRVEEWESVLKSEMWGLEQVKMELFPHLLLSYHELSPMLKCCFSYCAFFRKDERIEVERLIRLWMASGYLGSNIGSARDEMELKGREYFEDLAMRSLFQDFERDDETDLIVSCKMHDIVHDFAQFLRKNDREEASGVTNTSCQVCDPFIVSRVKEYRCLFWGEETLPNHCEYCLKSLRVLELKWGVNGNLSGIKTLIHLRWLKLSYKRLLKEEELPESMCNHEPKGIGELSELRELNGEFKIKDGMTPSSSTTAAVVAFPKLERLSFIRCEKWEEWEDITAEEEESAALHLMPSLAELTISSCGRLKMLPHRLLRKAESLGLLDVTDSSELLKRYEDKDGEAWRSISQIHPQLQLETWRPW